MEISELISKFSSLQTFRIVYIEDNENEAKENDMTDKAIVGTVFNFGDPSASYVTEEAKLAGGGYGHGPNDYFPDGYQITARKLNADGTYNPKRKTVVFMQKGIAGSSCYNTQREIIITGSMKRTVTFV